MPSDAGFSMLEAVISISLISIMIAGFCTFLIATTSITHRQGGQQAAVHLASDGVELVRAVSGPALPAGLPTSPETKTVSGVTYQRAWSVAVCWQPTAGGTCVVQNNPPSSTGYLKFFKITITVTWPDHGCPTAGCSYATTTLVDGVSTQPLFRTS